MLDEGEKKKVPVQKQVLNPGAQLLNVYFVRCAADMIDLHHFNTDSKSHGGRTVLGFIFFYLLLVMSAS